jgi:multidrug efflux pump subunit AcrA (membrane-fusion protein)
MNSRQPVSRNVTRSITLGVPFLFMFGAVWAKTPPPTESLQAAQQAIANAERVDAATNSAVELGEARSKLSLATAAVADKQMVVAQRLADEARVEAELAAARSTAAKANAVNNDMRRNTSTLIEEMQRKTGETK